MILYYIQSGALYTSAAHGYCWQSKTACQQYKKEHEINPRESRIKRIDTKNIEDIIQALTDFNSYCFLATIDRLDIKNNCVDLRFRGLGRKDNINSSNLFFQKGKFQNILDEKYFNPDETGKSRLPLNFPYINRRMNKLLTSYGWVAANKHTYIPITTPFSTIILMKGAYGEQTHWDAYYQRAPYEYMQGKYQLYVPKNIAKAIK